MIDNRNLQILKKNSSGKSEDQKNNTVQLKYVYIDTYIAVSNKRISNCQNPKYEGHNRINYTIEYFSLYYWNIYLLSYLVHQGSSLCPYLFALVMDEITKAIQSEVP